MVDLFEGKGHSTFCVEFTWLMFFHFLNEPSAVNDYVSVMALLALKLVFESRRGYIVWA